MQFTFKKTNYQDALKIASWQYPAPYQAYSPGNSPLVVVRLVDGCYYSVFARGQLVGFFCYGEASRLKTGQLHPLYQKPNYLDLGLGMRPKLCGRGWGIYFVRAGLTYAQKEFSARKFRLTVASDNKRAAAVYARLGFKEAGRINHSLGSISEFLVMILDDFAPAPEGAQSDLGKDLPALAP